MNNHVTNNMLRWIKNTMATALPWHLRVLMVSSETFRKEISFMLGMENELMIRTKLCQCLWSKIVASLAKAFVNHSMHSCAANSISALQCTARGSGTWRWKRIKGHMERFLNALVWALWWYPQKSQEAKLAGETPAIHWNACMQKFMSSWSKGRYSPKGNNYSPNEDAGISVCKYGFQNFNDS